MYDVTAKQAVSSFQKKFYPELDLSLAEMETLLWCMVNPIVTPSAPEKEAEVHFEVKRTFNRIPFKKEGKAEHELRS